uniref:Uncharacterized protein n=1 Tax=Calcidiscus leptoporus TaxID=127549 RepID=A0A7S0ISQ6_9EUKA|eukprot:CAMPEP_0119392516 /NCGR_PEP_ID=MMETSP1334-20130426/121507_1 /TAXON_ID=127549 /ORGANISM="Calcidiscus leptoporus, Strain RCC1130" /LENGTH=141 /DNA_ID=CAMNT_0007415379 /DNA_START=21 /DNA_END=446 /DNA_ORIENTATION=+
MAFFLVLFSPITVPTLLVGLHCAGFRLPRTAFGAVTNMLSDPFARVAAASQDFLHGEAARSGGQYVERDDPTTAAEGAAADLTSATDCAASEASALPLPGTSPVLTAGTPQRAVARSAPAKPVSPFSFAAGGPYDSWQPVL